MSALLTAFAIFAVSLLVQSVLSLAGGFRFLRSVRASHARPPTGWTPSVALIIPCKGVEADFEQNIVSYFAQNYPCYRLIFVVADAADPAYPKLRELISKSAAPTTASLVVAGYSESCGEKIQNLLRGLDAAEAGTEVFAFADSDGRPGADWLRSLVAPLADPKVTVSTGFRWYVPGPSFASQLRATWDASLATFLGDHNRNFAWGGSMAIRAADFRRLQVAERYWRNSVSDDYEVRRAVRAAGGKIHFEPRCLVPSHDESSLGDFLRWAGRQIILTRVYAPDLWAFGLASHLLYGLTFLLGLEVLILRGPTPWERLTVVGILAVILGLGMGKGGTRTRVAREVCSASADSPSLAGKCYWLFPPLVPWIMLWTFIEAGFKRRIEWRGVQYELLSDGRVKAIHRGNR